MMNFRTVCSAVLASSLLGGCVGDVDFTEIETLPRPEPGFQRSLGEAYLDYSKVEAGEYDRADAKMFAAKAVKAFANDQVLPTKVEDRRIGPDQSGDLQKAYDDLLSAFAGAGRTLAPDDMAAAQAAYDCWLQEQEEGHQPADILACRTKFETSLAAASEKLQATLVVLLEQDGGKVGVVTVNNAGSELLLNQPRQAISAADGKVPEEAGVLTDAEVNTLFGAALGAVPEAPLYFTLYFQTGSNELTAESAAMLPSIIETITRRATPDISVIGHSDRVGRAEVNARLSLVRSRSVADMLIARGVAPEIVEVTSFGESDNAVPTDDNVPEPANRRVEISVR